MVQDGQGSSVPVGAEAGRLRPYTEHFEVAWDAYGRREEKQDAFVVWLQRAKEMGGERALCTAVVGALGWQTRKWAEHDWKFAPYFSRYLKRRKYNDEPQVKPKPWVGAAEKTDALLRQRREQEAKMKPLTVEEIRALRGGK